MIKNKVLETIKEYKMFSPGDSIVLGVSGGADSTALLHLLDELKDEIKISSIYIAHLNHMLRKEDAEKDQRFVESLAKKLGLLCLSESIDVRAYAAQNKLNLENAGRILRYAFYMRVLKKVGASKIALGHNADDTVETFLMKLLRGAGLKGLTGIPPVREKIVRPLIRTWRREIDLYVGRLKIVPRIDHTNYESKYLRNRVRLKLIPQLKIYNLNIKEILLQTVLLLTEDNLYIEKEVKETLKQITDEQTRNDITLDVSRLRNLDLSVQGHLIRGAIEKVKGNLAEMAFSHIHEIMRHLDSTEDWELHLPDGVYAVGSKNSLTITKEKPGEPEKVSFYYTLNVPGEVVVKEADLLIKAALINEASKAEKEKDRNAAHLDFEETGKKLIVRSRKEGDRFYPLGMKGTKKIQDFFIDQKVPKEARDLIPLIESAGRIVWVTGLRIDERAKVKKKTKKIVRLTAEKI